MEIIKKLAAVVLFFWIASGHAIAQDYKALQEAFSSSYTLETAKKYTSAIETLKKVYTESSYELNLRLGWLHYLAGSYAESTNYYAKCIKLMPYSIEARLGFAQPAFAMGNLNQVEAKYLEILKIDASNYSALYRLGSIYYGRKDYTQAYRIFEKLVNMYPFDYDALHMFAWTNYRTGKLREAKVLFNKALLNKPNDVSAQEGLNLIK